MDAPAQAGSAALEMQTKGFMRIMEPLVARAASKQGNAIHARLKQVLESDGAGAGI